MSMNPIIRALIVLAASLALVVGWLVAEIREWRRGIRVLIGLTTILFLAVQIWATNSVAEMELHMHQFILCESARMVGRGQEAQAHRALRVYSETYERTKSREHAVYRARSVLTRPE